MLWFFFSNLCIKNINYCIVTILLTIQCIVQNNVLYCNCIVIFTIYCIVLLTLPIVLLQYVTRFQYNISYLGSQRNGCIPWRMEWKNASGFRTTIHCIVLGKCCRAHVLLHVGKDTKEPTENKRQLSGFLGKRCILRYRMAQKLTVNVWKCVST